MPSTIKNWPRSGNGTQDMLEVMADGRLWTRPALRVVLARMGWGYDWVKGRLVLIERRGLVERVDNPMADRGRPYHRRKGQRVESADYAYRITEKGRQALGKYRAGYRASTGAGRRPQWRKKDPLAALFGR